ncbi:hypothetical protein [Halobellus captivus]|uniref:hypothetical protein n=1 Tax=Halobellus captivus TaxID=2592614 RepID=UPI0011A454AC|nr:hypothetical protein [Halobellus captivus]
MSNVQTIHEKDEQGRQITRRVVTIEDATGEEFTQEFEAGATGHKYLGEGEPPESALEALQEYGE